MDDLTKMQQEQRKLSEGKIVFRTLCSTLNNRKWTYNAEEDKLIVRTSAVGQDLTMKLYIKVDAERSVMYLKSAMPFTVKPDRIDDVMRVVTVANWTMLNGMFEMSIKEGYIGFKMVVPFMESIISERLCNYMIDLSCRMVDVYNDKFLAVVDRRMSVAEFEKFAETAV